MAERDDETERRERNESIRKIIGQVKKGEPAPGPRTPRELTDEAAADAAKEADEDSDCSSED